MLSQTQNLTHPPPQQFFAERLTEAVPVSCMKPNVGCYMPSQFGGAAQRSFGNIQRNSFRGPQYFNTDLNVNRTIPIKERFRIILGASFFNVLNHPNFDLPVNNVTLANFGRIVQTVSQPTSAYGGNAGSAVSGRVIQTNVRLTF